MVPYAFVTVNRNEDGTVTVTNTVETSDADTTVAQRRAYRRLTTMAMIRFFFCIDTTVLLDTLIIRLIIFFIQFFTHAGYTPDILAVSE